MSKMFFSFVWESTSSSEEKWVPLKKKKEKSEGQVGNDVANFFHKQPNKINLII